MEPRPTPTMPLPSPEGAVAQRPYRNCPSCRAGLAAETPVGRIDVLTYQCGYATVVRRLSGDVLLRGSMVDEASALSIAAALEAREGDAPQRSTLPWRP